MFHRLIKCFPVFLFGSSDPFIVEVQAVLSIFLVAGEGTLVFILTTVFKSVSTFVKLCYFINEKSTNQKCTSSFVK